MNKITILFLAFIFLLIPIGEVKVDGDDTQDSHIIGNLIEEHLSDEVIEE